MIAFERTGLERNCSYTSFNSKTIDRKTYLKIMDVCIANAKSPILVHVSAFKDLPTEDENKLYKFENLITQEELSKEQQNANSIKDFISGNKKVLFTTKCSRGVRFKGDKVSLWSPDIRVINSKIGYSHQA